MNRRRLLVAGLAQEGVGLSVILNAITEQLANKWDILIFAHGTEDQHYEPVCGITTQSAPLQDWSPETQQLFEQAIGNFAPAVILIIGHPWKVPAFSAVAAKSPAKLAVYMPIEGRPTDSEIAASLSGVDLCIAYTAYARDALKHLLNGEGPTIINIGHGIGDEFRICAPGKTLLNNDTRQELRRKLFPGHPDFWGRPMLLNANRAYWRKRLDLTIEGFALAAADIDASLYLHGAALSRYERERLEALIQKFEIQDKVLLNALNITGKVIQNSDLISLYQACDAGITTSMGEGWGLCSFEHAATGAAQIVPDHTSFAENWPSGTAMHFPASEPFHVADEATEMYAGSAVDIGKAIYTLFESTETLQQYSANACAHAQRDDYHWTNIAAQFDGALESLLS